MTKRGTEPAVGTRVAVYDTTLRDAALHPGIDLGLKDQLRILERLDQLGVDFVDAGEPASDEVRTEFFRQAAQLPLRHAQLTALVPVDPARRAPDHPSLGAALASGAPVIAVATPVQPVAGEREAVAATIRHVTGEGRRAILLIEGFFDRYRADRAAVLTLAETARAAGAEWLIASDTAGEALPFDVGEVTAAAVDRLGPVVGIRSYDEGGVAVSNALAAVRAGARLVAGAVNGYGARSGTANLCTVIPNLVRRMGFTCLTPEGLTRLPGVARFVAEVVNLALDPAAPFVGQHAREALANPAPPRIPLVGTLPPETAARVRERVEALTAEGHLFDAADASLALLVRREAGLYRPPFTFAGFRVSIEKRRDEEPTAEATVRVRVGDRQLLTVAEGDGPVNALDNALRKALEGVFPGVKRVKLVDYKVRVLDERSGTAAKVRVLIESRDEHESWSTVGVSENIIEASWQALVESIEYGLLRQSEREEGRIRSDQE